MAKAEKAHTASGTPAGIARALGKRRQAADSEVLLTDIIEVWGGTRNLAMDMHKAYQEARPGSMTRQRILETIQRLIINNTNHGIQSAKKPSDLDDKELDALVLTYVARCSDTTPIATEPEADG